MTSHFKQITRSAYRTSWILCCLIIGPMVAFDLHAEQQARTVNDGVYSETQAERGQILYDAQCASCHGIDLGGASAPALTGAEFSEFWNNRTLSDLLNKIQLSMPQTSPGSLTLTQSADLVSYMLQVGKYPTGQEDLTSESSFLKTTLFVKSDTTSAGTVSGRCINESCVGRFSIPTGPSTYVQLPDSPSVFDSAAHRLRVVTVADGLSRPWSLAFLPDGNILVTERTGRLRIVRNGVLDPQPIAGVPDVLSRPYMGLMDVHLHPKFSDNKLVYLTYTKPGPDGSAATTLARGRFDGNALLNVQDIFQVDAWTDARSALTLGARLAFDRNGILYMSVASATDDWNHAQDPGSHLGKVLRLHDDGTVPPDNPFIGQDEYKPEIYTLGHRNPLGLAIDPETGLILQNEHGPQGGDEVNVLQPGRNYGWPLVSEGRSYGGESWTPHVNMLDMESPLMIWAPSIGPSGMTFYTGDKFPQWKGNVFVGSLSYAHLERIVLNENAEPTNREWLLLDLKQRIRDVRQGPDGLLYVVTDASYGALLRIEPVE